MRKLFFIFLLLSFTAHAKVYDLSDPNVSLCNGSLTGNIYECIEDLELKKNDSIVVSDFSLTDVLLTSTGTIKLNSNKVGTKEQPISLESLGDDVIIEGKDNLIYGFITGLGDVKLKNVRVIGDITSKGGDIIIEEKGNQIFGDILANHDVKLKNAKVIGDVTSKGGEVIIEEKGNQVFGDIVAHHDAKLKKVLVCGTITSTGGEVVIDDKGNKIYAGIEAINSFGKVTIKDADVCGTVTSSSGETDFDKANLYCGLNDANCDGFSNCPVSPSDDICNISPPSDNYILTITPEENYSLVCKDVEFTVLVMTDSDTPTPVIGKEIALQFDESKLTLLSSNLVTDNNGEVKLSFSKLDKQKIETITVKASLPDDSNVADEGEIHYVPYMFDTSSTKVIANLSHSFEIKVLACSNNNVDIVKSYEGTKLLDVSTYKLIQPNSSDGIRTDLQFAGKTNPSNVELTFDEGKATTSLTYKEAGEISFIVSDPSFTCPSGFDCKDYPVDSGLLSAAVNIESRPWKLEICSDVAIDGDSRGGSALVAAGDVFSLKVKPVRYGVATDFCNLPVTQNFFKPSAPFSSIYPSYELSTPTAGVKGILAPLAPIDNDVYVDVGRNSYYEFNNMAYSEVGSLLFKSEALSPTFYDGIQGGIEFGTKSIGRFYPAKFKLLTDSITYSTKQSFAYMNQSFQQNFIIEAQNVNEEPTNNYGLFTNSLIADVIYSAQYNGSSLFNDRIVDGPSFNWGGSSWKANSTGKFDCFINGPEYNSSQLCVWIDTFEITKYLSNVMPVSTTADGPIIGGISNTLFSLGVTGGDNVKFSNGTNSIEFENQPDVRYGRMVLDSVGTAVGQSVTIPLRVEYWNGNGFVISDTDNATTFNGANYCKQTIWPDPSLQSNSSLSGSNSDGIDSGVDRHNLKAIADTNNSTLREQVRFWLRLASTSPQIGEANMDCESGFVDQPWLQFNWRGQGDEDPSTVVTFGIYRGNDRVIFRGESNIIGTSN